MTECPPPHANFTRTFMATHIFEKQYQYLTACEMKVMATASTACYDIRVCVTE